jgi:hypothetical protein
MAENAIASNVASNATVTLVDLTEEVIKSCLDEPELQECIETAAEACGKTCPDGLCKTPGCFACFGKKEGEKKEEEKRERSETHDEKGNLIVKPRHQAKRKRKKRFDVDPTVTCGALREKLKELGYYGLSKLNKIELCNLHKRHDQKEKRAQKKAEQREKEKKEGKHKHQEEEQYDIKLMAELQEMADQMSDSSEEEEEYHNVVDVYVQPPMKKQKREEKKPVKSKKKSSPKKHSAFSLSKRASKGKKQH